MPAVSLPPSASHEIIARTPFGRNVYCHRGYAVARVFMLNDLYIESRRSH
jgi:hypothetical protein